MTRNPAAVEARHYRPDIDGLRAIAVVLVLLSHMRIAATAGGFVGVDIFFVISGYLITGNIASGIGRGTFSIAGFYERRIRRIFPALVAMLAATAILVYAIFPPTALVPFAQSMLAALFSYSNFYFATQSGYFTLTFTKILLHTWSLGVEEQFYLVLPICLILAAKGPPRTMRIVVAVLGSASFIYAAYLTLVDRDLAFYMPYARAWELLLGSSLALGMIPFPSSRVLRESLAALALALVLVCLFTYTEATPFPGLAAIPPCAAAAILILIGERDVKTGSTSFLSWRPVTFVGAISYSLYLWHWPVFLFLRLGVVPKLDYHGIPGLAVAKIVLSFAFATLSWRYVEIPFRTGRWKTLSRARVFATAAACAVLLSAVDVAYIAGNGLPGRFPPQANLVGDHLSMPAANRGPQCFVEANFAEFSPDVCLAQRRGKATALLLGDSHANALWPGLARAMPQAAVLQATSSACAPIKGGYDGSPCGALRRYIYERYLPTHHVDAAFLTEKWNAFSDLTALEPALSYFRARRIPVYLIGPGPEYTAPLPLLLALGIKWHEPAMAESHLIATLGDLDRRMNAQLAGDPGVRYASVWNAICYANQCEEYVGDPARGVPMLADDNHLSNAGAMLTVRRLQRMGELPLYGGSVFTPSAAAASPGFRPRVAAVRRRG